MRVHRGWLTLLVLVAACRSEPIPSDDSPDAAARADLGIRCPDVFPEFDRTCARDADCAIALHQINCCGTFVALGIRATGSASFDAAEATCRSQYGACGCPNEPTRADDGRTEADGTIVVNCTTGSCRTTVR